MRTKIRLEELASSFGLKAEMPEVIQLEWESERIRNCEKCGGRLRSVKEARGTRECEACGSKRSIRYGERQAGDFSDKDKTFRQRIIDKRDFYKPLSAFGLVPELLSRLEKFGCKTIILRDKENLFSYTVDFDIFLAKAIGAKTESGKQMSFLNTKYFKREALKAKKSFNIREKVVIKDESAAKNAAAAYYN